MVLKDKKILDIVSAALSLLGAVFYFLPFAVVDRPLTDSFSGFKLFAELFSHDIFNGSASVMSIWIIVAFLSLLAAIVFALGIAPVGGKGEGLRLAGICSVISAVTLILGSIALSTVSRGSGLALLGLSMTGAGWWLALAASALSACAALYGCSLAKNEKPPMVY